jgi:TrmH family RNA methyltransferase
VTVFACNAREFEKLSDTVQSQGILAVVAYTSHVATDSTFADFSGSIIPAFIRIADPGNLGTVLRTAEWFGDRVVLLSEGSVDETNPKVTRASAGSLMRLHVARFSDAGALIETARGHGFEPVATVPSSGTPLHKIEGKRKLLVFFGSEAHGVGEDVERLCARRITIPSAGDAESLNVSVACAITLYELHRP